MTTLGRLDKVNPVLGDEADPAVVEFAGNYLQANRGSYRPGGPKLTDEQRAEHFAERYTSKVLAHGFAGSGTTEYRGPDGVFRVERRANGRTFYGTDHTITKVTP